MRSIKQVELQIEEVKRQIDDTEKLQEISVFKGSDTLIALFEKTRDFYKRAMESLDENSPVLGKEYAKNKICIVLITGFIERMKDATPVLQTLKNELITLNGELQNIREEQIRRKKESY